MEGQINQLKLAFDKDLNNASKAGKFDELFLKYFSRKTGIVTLLLRQLPTLDDKVKREVGPLLNSLQNDFKNQITTAHEAYIHSQINNPLMDLTYPETPSKSGMLHPITQTIREINQFFRYHGFSVAESAEIETAEYNFRKLNLPENHPATDLQDTLFISEPNILLRTHTSSVETRVLSTNKPPIRVVAPGKVFRNETANATNLAFFHQYQGFVVDEDITLQNLKGTLEEFHKFLFGNDVVLRFRYKYYPEVSPGMGVDMQCKFCDGEGCNVCKYRGYIEVLGSGMIHYNTLKMCGIDPNLYTGFAFGMGLDRLAMQKFGIDDIRKLYGGEVVYI